MKKKKQITRAHTHAFTLMIKLKSREHGLTCSKSRSSAQMAAIFQSIFDSNGSAHEFDSNMGIHPA